MPSFSDIGSSLTLPSCCMRKNPTLKQQLNDDMKMLGVSFSLYLLSYWLGFHSLCLLSMTTMNLLTFQAGITFHELYSKPVHQNEINEADSSDSSDVSEELSLKQKEHGASISRPMTEEQEDKLNRQLQQVVQETRLRNRKRGVFNNTRTPSATTLVEDGEIPRTNSPNDDYPPIPSSDTEFDEMPALISPDDANPILRPIYNINKNWSDTPSFSQTHYLHGYMDDCD